MVYDPGSPEPEITDISASPNPFSPMAGETCTISYNLTYDARVRIRVGVDGGPLVKTLLDWELQFAGPHSVIWDGTDEMGYIVEPGDYKVAFWADTIPENSIIVEEE